MSKRVQAKHKICRRQGVAVCGSSKCPVHERNYVPGQHGPVAMKGVLSDFGKQLRAKQQLKKSYSNITEKQFSNIYKEAARMKGDTSENLIGLLESRLDSIVFRANFAPTMFSARQIVNHNHLTVNGRKVNISSYQLKIGDVIQIRERSQQVGIIMQASQSNERQIPDYLEVDSKKMTAKFIRLPKITDVPYPVIMEPNLVTEFYSR